MNSYKYEIAFSLCKQDKAFAGSIVNELNPSLEEKVFLYTENQKELISEIGPEKFMSIFRNDSRIVVILYRQEYGESYYTQLEKDAIIERLGIENQGYGFIFLIPMIQGIVPGWYPSTRIYADPYTFSVKQLAKFIEFKAIERDAVIIPPSFQDRLQHFEKLQETRKSKVLSLNTSEKIKDVKDEIETLKKHFKLNIELIRKSDLSFSISDGPDTNPYFMGFDNYVLEMLIEDDSTPNFYFGMTSNFRARLSIFTKEKYNFQNIGTEKKFIEQTHYRFNFENQEITGWSEEINFGTQIDRSLHPYFFKCGNHRFYYYLSDFITSKEIIDIWFSKLLDTVKKEFTQKLK